MTRLIHGQEALDQAIRISKALFQWRFEGTYSR